MKYLFAIRAWIKKRVERIRNERLRLSLYQALPFWVASLIAGIVAVAYAKLFALAEDLFLFFTQQVNWIVFIVTPIAFLLSALIVQFLAPYARGSGIPQVMASIELANTRKSALIDKLLSFRIIIVKMASSLVMVAGGGAIGREGPTIQIAGSVFHLVNKFIPKSWPKITKRNMVMTGASAGLAAAFNTPLGGIVFAVEELTKTHISYFRTALFSAVIIAGLTAQGILGPYLYLGFPQISGLSTFIFAAVILTAIIAGLGGSIFSTVVLKLMEYKARRSKRGQWFFVLSCGFTLAFIAYFLSPVVLGSGKTVMTQLLFSDKKEVSWFAPFLRIVGPILSFTIGGAGGVFAPALSAGACFGGMVAGWFNVSAGEANLLVLSGMVAFLTGVTRTPFTAAILVLEMTDRHSIIFYLMLAALIANVVSLLIDKRSLYDHLKKQYLHEVDSENRATATATVAEQEGG